MKAFELGPLRVADALRVVTALGAHRYVAGRMHLVHALAFASAAADGRSPASPEPGRNLGQGGGLLSAGEAWAKELLDAATSNDLDIGSLDERLWRRSTEAEVAALLDAFWTPGQRAQLSREALRSLLERHGFTVPNDQTPFDEKHEETLEPLLVDAGWELLSLNQLDPERHKGAIAAFGDVIAFESACFEEETAIPPAPHLDGTSPASPGRGRVVMMELPALGPTELLRGATDEGTLSEPLVVWADGHETYVDYIIRGVRRAARLPEAES
jgi:hypothetical protein